MSDFHQREPFEGTEPTEKTRVKILYDATRLYFGIECFDSAQEGIIATELRRDTDFTVDDYFSILISPNNDARNAYVFTFNPLGTQFDSTLADEGRVKDPNWDGVWVSNARITSTGWTATLAIPFSTLNFKSSDDVSLGINFLRFIRRKNEEDLWRSYLRIYGLERVSQAGQLTDLREIGSGRLFLIKPYVLTGFRSNSEQGTQALHSGGFDLKYGLRSNLVANLTVNTDFADVDVDPLRFNITPFKIFLPEKRPFFLENSGFFQFGDQQTNQLFFSRQIGIDPVSGQQVHIDAGAKVTGTLGNYEVGILDVHTRESGVNPSANYGVARVKRRLFSESFIGAMAIDKESNNPLDRYNRAAGVDSNLVFFEKLSIYSYLTKTFSYSPIQRGKDWADEVSVDYKSNLVQAQYRHYDVQPNYNPEVGFIDRVDLATNFADVTVSPRPKRGPIRELNFEAFVTRQHDTHGVLQTQEWQATFRANFHNGAYTDDDIVDNFIQRLTTPFNIFSNVFIPAGLYHFDRHQFVRFRSKQTLRLQFLRAVRNLLQRYIERVSDQGKIPSEATTVVRGVRNLGSLPIPVRTVQRSRRFLEYEFLIQSFPDKLISRTGQLGRKGSGQREFPATLHVQAGQRSVPRLQSREPVQQHCRRESDSGTRVPPYDQTDVLISPMRQGLQFMGFWPLAFVAASVPVQAQTATLRGQTIDESGAVIPGAKVTLNGPSGLVKSGMSANDGSFSFTGLTPDDYSVHASAPDLALSQPVRIHLKAGVQTLNLEVLQLENGASDTVSGWGLAGHLYFASASSLPRLS